MIPTYTPQERDHFELSPKDNLADYDALEYIGVVKAVLEAGELNDYNLHELQKVEGRVSKAYSALSNEEISKHENAVHQIFYDLVNLQNIKEDEEKKSLDEAVSTLNEIVDTYDHTPESKARIHIATVQKDLAAGKFDRCSLAQLQEVEDKFKEDYAVITNGEVYQDAEFATPYAETILALTDLQNAAVEKGIEDLVKEEVKELSEEEKDSVGYSILNLPIAPQEEVRKRSNGNKSYQAACVTSLPAKSAAPRILEDKVIINYTVITPQNQPVNSLPLGSDGGIIAMYKAAQKNLEAVVVPFPAPKKKSTLGGYLAKAAFVAAAGIASLVVGYNYLAAPVNTEADQLKHYHGSPSVEAAPVNKVKPVEQNAGAKSAEARPVPSPIIVASQPSPPSRAAKSVKRYPASWHPYDSNLHSVEKGDTLGGLYEDYAAGGGPLPRTEYIKIILNTNSHLENENTIYVGQEIILPYRKSLK